MKTFHDWIATRCGKFVHVAASFGDIVHALEMAYGAGERNAQLTRYLEVPLAELEESGYVLYAGGYKYQNRKDSIFNTGILPETDIVTDLVVLRRDGWLFVGKYFAWDGPSGPSVDGKSNIRASLAHDALYYLIRIGLLDAKWKAEADRLLERCMRADGASRFRAGYYKLAVEWFGSLFGGLGKPGSWRKVRRAP